MTEMLGEAVFYIGGILFALLILGILAYLAGSVWVDVSNKLRDICKAESLIFEYKKHRNDFMYWLNMQKGDMRNDRQRSD